MVYNYEDMKRHGFIVVCGIIIITVVFMLIDSKLFDNKKDMYTYLKNPLLCGFLSGCAYYFAMLNCKTATPENKVNLFKSGIPFYKKSIPEPKFNTQPHAIELKEKEKEEYHDHNQIPPGEIILTGDPTN
jgi:hypothetical protein